MYSWTYRVAAVFVSTLVAGSAAQADATLDQSFVFSPAFPNGYGASIGEGVAEIGQSVTAGQSGYLTRADVHVQRISSYLGSWTLRVMDLRPSSLTYGQTLTSQLLGAADVAGSSQFYAMPPTHVDFSVPVLFEAGDQFALLMSADGTTGAGNFKGVWSGRPGGGYAGGTVLGDPGADLYFQTYMSSVPEPGIAGVLAAGVAMLGLRRRRA